MHVARTIFTVFWALFATYLNSVLQPETFQNFHSTMNPCTKVGFVPPFLSIFAILSFPAAEKMIT